MDAGAYNGNYAIFETGDIPARPHSGNKKWWVAPVALGCIALVAIAGAGAYFGLREDPSSSSTESTPGGISGSSTSETSSRSAAGIEQVAAPPPTEAPPPEPATPPPSLPTPPPPPTAPAPPAPLPPPPPAPQPAAVPLPAAAAPPTSNATTVGLLDDAAPDAASPMGAAGAPLVATPLAADPAVAPGVDPMSPLASGAPAMAPGFMEEELLPGDIALDANGKYPACIGTFGKMKGHNACGVQVLEDGTVILAEFFGGFDGFFSTDPADGHESCFNTAVAQVLGVPICNAMEGYSKTITDKDTGEEELRIYTECEAVGGDMGACACCAMKGHYAVEDWQRDWPGNAGVIEFLEVLRSTADPVDFDFDVEADVATADGGGRLANRDLVAAVFESMITPVECPEPEEEVDGGDEEDGDEEDPETEEPETEDEPDAPA